jgi:hypothetical protein
MGNLDLQVRRTCGPTYTFFNGDLGEKSSIQSHLGGTEITNIKITKRGPRSHRKAGDIVCVPNSKLKGSLIGQ